MTVDPAALRYDDRGLVPVVVQDEASGAVLMLGYANREAVERTVATGEAHFWSRSRGELWRKGATSGNVLRVVSIDVDCDADALLVRARPAGPTCHTGARSCFGATPARLELGWLAGVIEARRDADLVESYTARLLTYGLPRIAQKVGEEATETVVAALAGEERELVGEAADLLYHLLVLLAARGIDAGDVAAELQRRHTAEEEE